MKINSNEYKEYYAKDAESEIEIEYCTHLWVMKTKRVCAIIVQKQ